MTTLFDVRDGVRKRVLDALVADGFTRFADGTPLQRRAPSLTFERLFALDDEASPLKDMMEKGIGPYGDGPYGAPENGAAPEMTPAMAKNILAALKPKVDASDYERFTQLFRELNLLDENEVGAMDSAASFSKMFSGSERVTRVAATPMATGPRAGERTGARRTSYTPNAAAAEKFDELFPGASRIERAA